MVEHVWCAAAVLFQAFRAGMSASPVTEAAGEHYTFANTEHLEVHCTESEGETSGLSGKDLFFLASLGPQGLFYVSKCFKDDCCSLFLGKNKCKYQSLYLSLP